MTKIAFLKYLDCILGTLAVRSLSFLSGRKGAQAVSVKRVLFIRPGGIGDAVHLVPAILALKETYPDVVISVLAERRNGGVFAMCPAIDLLYLYDTPFGLLKSVTAAYDAVFDTEQWHRFPAIVALLTQAPMRVGFATNERKRLFTNPVNYSHQEHEVESFQNLLTSLSVTVKQGRIPFLTIPSDVDGSVEKLLGELVPLKFVALFPGASIPERRWGSDNFCALAEQLKHVGIEVVIVGGKEDVGVSREISRKTGSYNLSGKTTLVETAAVLARSSLLVTGDSGLLHIAAGLGVPTVSLFGPGIEAKWAPRGDIHTVINKRLGCSPCTVFGTTAPCAENARCIKEIPVQEVLQAVRRQLDSQRHGEKDFRSNEMESAGCEREAFGHT